MLMLYAENILPTVYADREGITFGFDIYVTLNCNNLIPLDFSSAAIHIFDEF